MYGAETLPPSQYTCDSGPRDTKTDYIFGTERAVHPQHASRFGYDRCWNGYCTGTWIGRYNTPPECMPNEQPKGMAPERFYHGKFVDPFYDDNKTYRYEREMRGLMSVSTGKLH